PSDLIWIIRNSTRHPTNSKEMHWKKCNIYPNKHNPKMKLSQFLIINNTKHFWKPIIKCSKQRKNSPHRRNIMKMCNNIISIVQSNINSRICQNNPSQTTNCKQKYKPQSKQNRGSNNYWGSPQCCQP